MLPAVSSSLLSTSRAGWHDLETLHVVGYFAPEVSQAYVDLGLHPRLSHFPARAAAFGEAGPALTTAAFYVFAPWLVERALPSAWKTATPEQLVTARRSGISRALRGLLGEPDPDSLAEALSIAREVCAGLSAAGRPLYAAHASLPWPEDDLVGLWHAATLIREHRGDGHLTVLQHAEVDPVEATVLGGLWTGTTTFLRASRGWSDDEYAAAVTRLRERGWLDERGGFTDEGRTRRQHLEDETDRLAVEGWAQVSEEQAARLREIVAPMQQAVLDSGVLSPVRP